MTFEQQLFDTFSCFHDIHTHEFLLHASVDGCEKHHDLRKHTLQPAIPLKNQTPSLFVCLLGESWRKDSKKKDFKMKQYLYCFNYFNRNQSLEMSAVCSTSREWWRKLQRERGQQYLFPWKQNSPNVFWTLRRDEATLKKSCAPYL